MKKKSLTTKTTISTLLAIGLLTTAGSAVCKKVRVQPSTTDVLAALNDINHSGTELEICSQYENAKKIFTIHIARSKDLLKDKAALGEGHAMAINKGLKDYCGWTE